MTFSLYADNNGFKRANVASSAPTMVLSRPSSASFGVRASGASTYLVPFLARSSRIFAVEAGSGGAQDSVLTVDDLLDLWRTGDAENHDIRGARQLGIGLHFLCARGKNVLGRLAILVQTHRQRKAFGDQVLGHAVTHQSQANKADSRLVRTHDRPFGKTLPGPPGPWQGTSRERKAFTFVADPGGSLLTWFYRRVARILPQSTAAGSEGGKLARQRSYHVITTPLPAMVTIPASVHPSGNVSNTTHPASVDHSSCMYVKGAMAETDAR